MTGAVEAASWGRAFRYAVSFKKRIKVDDRGRGIVLDAGPDALRLDCSYDSLTP